MYRPSLDFDRTPAERADQCLSWRRSDQAFFAAGACHILAWEFCEVYSEKGFRPVGLALKASSKVVHVYASGGAWAFDHCGWTPETDLLTVTRLAYRHQAEEVERVGLPADLASFCAQYNHRLPAQYAFDPRPRARSYLAQFRLP